MENDLVTIAQFQFIHDVGLTILQHQLEEAGIEPVIFNENMGGVAPFGSWAGGGIQVRVHSEDESLAREIWNKVQALPEYTDLEEPELAGMRQEEEIIAKRNWNACLFSLIALGVAFYVLKWLGFF